MHIMPSEDISRRSLSDLRYLRLVSCRGSKCAQAVLHIHAAEQESSQEPEQE